MSKVRELFEARENFWFWFTLITLLGLLLRLYSLELRPFHNDEGVNFHFIEELFRKGYYPYSHENYHGPLFFYLTAFFVFLFGESELAFRLPSVALGLAMPLTLLPLRSVIGNLAVLASQLLLIITPSLVYYNRYAIHETLLVVGILWLAVSLFKLMTELRLRWLLQAAFAFAIMVTTKETFIISCFALTVATFSLYPPRETLRRLGALVPKLGLGAALSFVLILSTFSGGFRWLAGLREMVLAVPQWVSRNDSDVGHHKAFEYYVEILASTEALLLLGLLVGLVFFIPQRLLCSQSGAERVSARPLFWKFGRYVWVWSVLTLLVYSVVKYKTPWLIINISVPLCLLLVVTLVHASDREQMSPNPIRASLWRYSPLFFLVAFLCLSAKVNYKLNITSPIGDENPYSYVHTSFGMRDLIEEIEKRYEPKDKPRILVGVNQYWPLPYYLREYSREGGLGYLADAKASEQLDKYDVLILNKKRRASFAGWSEREYRLSDVQESWTLFREQG